MAKQRKFKKQELNKPVTLGTLLEYTDEFLIPKIGELMDDRFAAVDKKFETVDKRFGEMEYNLKVYIDDKLANQTAEIFKRLNKMVVQDQIFKNKIIDILQQHRLTSPDNLILLKSALLSKII